MSRLMIGFCGPGVGVLVGVAVAVAVRVGVGVHVGHCVGVAVNVAVGEGVMVQHVTVGPGVRVGVAVAVLVAVAVGVTVGVAVGEGVGPGVHPGQSVGVGDGVAVAVLVAVAVGVAVGVLVGVAVGVRVGVAVGDAVGVEVGVHVVHGVGVGPTVKWRTKMSYLLLLSLLTRLLEKEVNETNPPSSLRAGSSLSKLPSPPSAVRLTRSVVPASRSRRYTSWKPLVSSAMRFVAVDSNTTKRPSPLTSCPPTFPLEKFPSPPALSTLMRPVVADRRSRRNTSSRPLVSAATRFDALDTNVTHRPSELIAAKSL